MSRAGSSDSMDRRTFLKTVIGGGVTMIVGHAQGAPGAKPNPAETISRAAAGRELAQHRIKTMTVCHLRDRFPRYVGRNAKGRPEGRGGGYQVRIITTDKGVRGWGMSHAKPDAVKQFVGAKLGDLFDMKNGVADDAFLLQIPLYDLVGNVLRMPVYKLLGANGPTAVPVYSGAIYFDDLEPPRTPRGVAGVIASCRQDYEAGYRAFKLKVGRCFKWMKGEPGLKRDIELVKAVHKQFPDCRVLVDANDGYTVDQAVRFVAEVADCDLYWFEEPFPEDRRKLTTLKKAMEKAGCKALIADGEARTECAKAPWTWGGYSRKHVKTNLDLATDGLIDAVVFDLGIVGFTRWARVMPELKKLGVLASPHTWCWTPRPYYAAQLGAGVGNVCTVEGIPGAAKGVDYSAYTFDKKGNLIVPRTPGFGLTLTT